MATITHKQAFLDRIVPILKKKYPAEPAADSTRTVLEHLLYAICREGTTSDQADAAFDRVRKHFFDWNEVRVSSVHEVVRTLGKLPNCGDKARRLIGILQELFELNFTFDLQDLDKNGLKKAATKLGRFGDVNDFVLAWVMQHALGGHAIPLDRPALRVLSRLGVVECDDENTEAIRGSVEHMIPKAKGPAFTELLSAHAATLCTEEEPACAECPLKKDCPAGQERLSEAAAAAKAARVKSR